MDILAFLRKRGPCQNVGKICKTNKNLKNVPKVSRTQLGGSLVGVWNGWGYGIAFFRALNFQISEPEIWQKSPFLRNFRDFSGNFGL